MSDGIIKPDTGFAQSIGFTSDKFDGYLRREGERVMISLIISKQPGEGHFSELVDAIKGKSLRVAVPNPLPRMKQILICWGFIPHIEESDHGEVDVWERVPDFIERAEGEV